MVPCNVDLPFFIFKTSYLVERKLLDKKKSNPDYVSSCKENAVCVKFIVTWRHLQQHLGGQILGVGLDPGVNPFTSLHIQRHLLVPCIAVKLAQK